jgi:hypothetical protein
MISKSEKERVKELWGFQKVFQWETVILRSVREQDRAPKIIGFLTRTENQVHIVHDCYLDSVI